MQAIETDQSLLAARNISFAYAEAPTLRGVSLALARGSLRALIGPNGSGKTTLLKMLTGILTPADGQVEWEGVNLKKFSRRELARRIALVPQELNLGFDFTVREMVLLGRTPYVGALAGPTAYDQRVVDQTLKLTETDSLAERSVTELSGGEKQRAVIAMALAQEPQALLLDEPTVHLDINHQIEILELLRRLNRERGLTVLATMHDLNLAALYFDELVMLEAGRVIACGSPAEVLRAERIREVFRADVLIQPHPVREETPQVILLPETSD